LFGEFSAFEQEACNLTSAATNMARGVKEGRKEMCIFQKSMDVRVVLVAGVLKSHGDVCLQKSVEVRVELAERESF